jgi:hypothetical protein
MIMKVVVSCFTCGKPHERDRDKVVEHNFCGRACFSVWRTSDDWCGARNPAWKGGRTSYRGPNWKRQSRAARKRDADTCQRCGQVSPHHNVHHIKPYRLWKHYLAANHLDNLRTLCKACHGLEEDAYISSHPDTLLDWKTPDTTYRKSCRKCGVSFIPRTYITVICDACCTIICAGCGKSFYTRKATHRIPKFCSRTCSAPNRIARPKILPVNTCVGCGISFDPIGQRHRRYCSRPCYWAHKSPRLHSSPTTNSR